MTDAGFTKIEKMPRNHPYFAYPIEWQIGYTAIKPKETYEK
jgi:hypothetical protein